MRSVIQSRWKLWAGAVEIAVLLAGSLYAQTSKKQPPPRGPVKHHRPHPILRLTLAPVPYRLASPCNLQNPVLTLFAKVQNVGDAPSSRIRINVVDNSLAPPWKVQTLLPGLSPGEAAAINIPVPAYAPSAAMVGNHTFRFIPAEARLEDLEVNPAPELHVTIPRGFCNTALKGIKFEVALSK
jgi:hypothetical protein